MASGQSKAALILVIATTMAVTLIVSVIAINLLSNMRMADDGIETAGVLVQIPEIRLGSLLIERVGALAFRRDTKVARENRVAS